MPNMFHLQINTLYTARRGTAQAFVVVEACDRSSFAGWRLTITRARDAVAATVACNDGDDGAGSAGARAHVVSCAAVCVARTPSPPTVVEVRTER